MPFLNMSDTLKTSARIDSGIMIHGVPVDILRLDLIHDVVSGNKLFKLLPYLKVAGSAPEKRLITFGGPFSNHLHATAFACKHAGIECAGIVRGEENDTSNPTLAACKDLGMQLCFVSRSDYKKWAEQPDEDMLGQRFGNGIIVPAGGFGPKGAEGASQILKLIPESRYTHICVATGTATTLAGLLLQKRPETIVTFPALKGMNDIPARLQFLGVADIGRLQIESDFHFGGFARSTPQLLDFMNRFFRQYQVPLDFVYTAKMFFGIVELIRQRKFAPGNRILAIHTGGLQGNLSLPPGTLQY